MHQLARFALIPVIAALSACTVPPGDTFAPFDAASTAKAKVHKNCAFDAVDSALATASNAVKRKPVSVSGWVTDDEMRAPTEFVLVLSGPQTFARKVPTGVSRPDVAQVLGSPSAASSGFLLPLDFGPVPPGTYTLSAALLSNTRSLVCQFNRSIVVSD